MASGSCTTLSLSRSIYGRLERCIWRVKTNTYPRFMLLPETDEREGFLMAPADPNYLDPEIWKDLPEELLDYIRSKLSFNSHVQSLAVSRSWMLAIENSNSLIPENRIRRSRGLVLQLCSRPITAYNSGKWKLFPKLPGPDGSLKVVASEGGLLCMRSSTQRELVVWNPVTKRVRYLRIPHIEYGFYDDVIKRMSCLDVTESFYRIGMVYNSKENYYHLIVAVVMSGVPGVTLVYNSSKRSWKRVGGVPRGYSFFLNTLSTENSFFCGMNSDKQLLLEYNVQLETWKTMAAIPKTSSFPTCLIKVKGEVVLLSEVRSGVCHFTLRKLCLYRLQESTEPLELEDILPQRFVKDVLKASNAAPKGTIAEVKCIIVGDSVFFVALTLEAGYLTSWFRRRANTFMRIWSHRLNDGEVTDSFWSSIGYKTDNIDWGNSCKMMRSDYSRSTSLVIVPSLIGQP
ncbi:hypothetical protein R1flu_007047 [Riccia fluitans]|uniref:F-box associated beta-propeller type 1 domain-containing protein n=1 Tax=Riccia fluitans TaxID=41844 RepID=A0ABD1YXQ7_9MARC